MMQETKGSSAIYNFGLPNVVDGVKFTCALCGGPAISELEIFDEVVCDVCYSKMEHIREEVDNQFCYETRCTKPIESVCCDGECKQCMVVE